MAALAAAATAETWDETFPDDGTLHPSADQVIAVEGEDLNIKNEQRLVKFSVSK